jgi:hypothetical protein
MIAWIAVSFAGCDPSFAAPPDTQSVVWVSRLGKTVRAGARLRVVPVSALRKAAKKKAMTPGRVLQLMGNRKKARSPKRPWKVTIFEASSGALCRPLEGDETVFIDGLPACSRRESKPSREDTGCATTVDRASGKPGLELYRASWRQLAPQGFCVMPLERFVAEM